MGLELGLGWLGVELSVGLSMESGLGFGLGCVGVGVVWASSEVYSVRALESGVGLGCVGVGVAWLS